jgi:hypothetical protein
MNYDVFRFGFAAVFVGLYAALNIKKGLFQDISLKLKVQNNRLYKALF